MKRLALAVAAMASVVTRPAQKRPTPSAPVPLAEGRRGGELTLVTAALVESGSPTGVLGLAGVPVSEGGRAALSDEEMDELVRPVYENLDPRVRTRLLTDLAAASERLDAEVDDC